MNQAQHALMQIVQQIAIFDGLMLEQAQILIQISKFKKFETSDTVYDVGAASHEMRVLIKGKLSVLSATGQSLGEVVPGNPTGEMGLFTGHARSATIVAAEDCVGLAITRILLMDVVNNDREMKAIILENVVRELSGRLAESNERLDVMSQALAQATTSDENTPIEAADEETLEADTLEEQSVGENDDDEMPAAEDLA